MISPLHGLAGFGTVPPKGGPHHGQTTLQSEEDPPEVSSQGNGLTGRSCVMGMRIRAADPPGLFLWLCFAQEQTRHPRRHRLSSEPPRDHAGPNQRSRRCGPFALPVSRLARTPVRVANWPGCVVGQDHNSVVACTSRKPRRQATLPALGRLDPGPLVPASRAEAPRRMQVQHAERTRHTGRHQAGGVAAEGFALGRDDAERNWTISRSIHV